MTIWIWAKASVFEKLSDYFSVSIDFGSFVTYVTDVQTKLRSPCNSTLLKLISTLTGLLPPCLIAMRLIFNGSNDDNAIFGSPTKQKAENLRPRTRFVGDVV